MKRTVIILSLAYNKYDNNSLSNVYNLLIINMASSQKAMTQGWSGGRMLLIVLLLAGCNHSIHALDADLS